MFGTRLLPASATAIVLVGGLAPMSLAQPLPPSMADLETRQVGPGIVRVVGDGTGRSLDDLRMLFIGRDGSVWAGRDKRVFRLGVAGSSPRLQRRLGRYEFSISEDGSVRVRHPREGLLELRDGQWEPASLDHPVHPDANDCCPPFQASDDSWWFGLKKASAAEALRYTPDGAWERLALHGAEGTASQFIETPDGMLWAVAPSGGISSTLFSFDGERWQRVDVPVGEHSFDAQSLRLDDDGMLVVDGIGWFGNGPERVDVVRSDRGWVVEPVRDLWEEYPLLFKADLEPLGEDGTGWAIGEDGKYLAWFDGETATRLDVPSRPRSVRPRIKRYQVAADGSIWVVVEDRVTGDNLYAISPEAVAAIE